MPVKRFLGGCLVPGLFLWGVLAAGCVAPYIPPTEQQPHAVLKLRRSYVDIRGTYLRERFLIHQKYSLFSQTVSSRRALNPLTDAVLIHPEAAQIDGAAVFFHHEERLVREPYLEQEPYWTSESYNCGSGGVHRTCTRSVVRNRTVTRYHSVWRTVEVADASCADILFFQPLQGHVYLLELTVQGPQSCFLSCFEQRQNSDGTFTNSPCAPLARTEMSTR